MNTAAIMGILSMVDAIMGSETAKKVLALFKQSPGLTDAQKVALDVNYGDYQVRAARLKDEIAADNSEA